jgi:hypothetical protein
MLGDGLILSVPKRSRSGVVTTTDLSFILLGHLPRFSRCTCGSRSRLLISAPATDVDFITGDSPCPNKVTLIQS